MYAKNTQCSSTKNTFFCVFGKWSMVSIYFFSFFFVSTVFIYIFYVLNSVDQRSFMGAILICTITCNKWNAPFFPIFFFISAFKMWEECKKQTFDLFTLGKHRKHHHIKRLTRLNVWKCSERSKWTLPRNNEVDRQSTWTESGVAAIKSRSGCLKYEQCWPCLYYIYNIKKNPCAYIVSYFFFIGFILTSLTTKCWDWSQALKC